MGSLPPPASTLGSVVCTIEQHTHGKGLAPLTGAWMALLQLSGLQRSTYSIANHVKSMPHVEKSSATTHSWEGKSTETPLNDIVHTCTLYLHYIPTVVEL